MLIGNIHGNVLGNNCRTTDRMQMAKLQYYRHFLPLWSLGQNPFLRFMPCTHIVQGVNILSLPL